MEVKVINKSLNPLPVYAKDGDSGVDLRADLSNLDIDKLDYGAAYDDIRETLIVFPKGRCIVPVGLFTSFPPGYEIQIRPRSGLAIKHGITVVNSPGTIDSGYRNEWGVILMNLGDEPFEIKDGDRIAQAVLTRVSKIDWKEVEQLDSSDRGLTGYGDSGVK